MEVLQTDEDNGRRENVSSGTGTRENQATPETRARLEEAQE